MKKLVPILPFDPALAAAQENGAAAARAGAGLDANPYPVLADEWWAWERGFVRQRIAGISNDAQRSA
jgi:hypothetical protein